MVVYSKRKRIEWEEVREQEVREIGEKRGLFIQFACGKGREGETLCVHTMYRKSRILARPAPPPPTSHLPCFACLPALTTGFQECIISNGQENV